MDNPAQATICRNMDAKSDIVIVGGGLNGCALALALGQAGLQVTLIDSQKADLRKETAFDGRSYALALASTRLLRGIGVFSDLQGDAQPIEEIKVTDGRAGEGPSQFWMHFERGEIEDGPMGYMIEDRHLRRAFLDAITLLPAITHLDGHTVTDQSVGSVTLEDGRKVHAQLVIGADGRKSGVAERAGITRNLKDYGQTALVAAIGHERPHNGIAHQFFMPAGPLAILPLTGNRSSIVWAESHARADEIAALDDTAFIEALRPAFGDFLGGLHVAGARFSYPLNQTVAKTLIAERLALIGDAAHGIHPIAGQGLNQGLRDVGALVEVLVDARRRGEDIAAAGVLQRYAQWRRFDIASLAMATDGFNTLFSNDNPLARIGRDLGMGLVNAMPGLKRRFMREAAGLTGDLPRLLKGEPL